MTAVDGARVARQALQVQLASFAGTSLPAEWAGLLEQGLGGICLFGSNLTGDTDVDARLVASIHAVRPAALVATDEEGGDVTRLHVRDASPVPGPAALGAVDDLALTEYAGRAVGVELAAVGVDLDLAPSCDVNSNPANPVIGTRSFGADPARVGGHAGAWLRGLQAVGVAGCVKHFPGHGDTAQDSHLTMPVLDAPEVTVRARDLAPFAAAVEAGAATVMTSHLLVPALDPDLPATLSPAILGLLRDELGFDGAIVTDALDMAGASAGRGIPEAAVLALAAGADLLCLGADKEHGLVRAVRAAIVDAVGSGRLPAARLTEAAGRVSRIRRADRSGEQDADPQRLLDAARRALVVEGELPDLDGARVVTIETPPNIAVGESRWGVTADVVVRPGEPLPPGPLVVQVRDAQLHPAVTDALAASAAPVLLIEWGWPAERGAAEVARLPRVCTRGSSRPAIAAVEELLRRAGWSR